MSNDRSVFARLFSHETAASSLRKNSKNKSHISIHSNKISQSNTISKFASKQQGHDARDVDNHKILKKKKDLQLSTSKSSSSKLNESREKKMITMKPKVSQNYSTSGIKLLISSKYNPEYGFSQLNPHGLGLNSFLCQYEEGSLSSSFVAKEIIEALFYRDHMAGKRWDIDPSYVEETKDEDIGDNGDNDGIFIATKEATWDHKDIYAVSTAKATIYFFRKKGVIKIDKYSFYTAG